VKLHKIFIGTGPDHVEMMMPSYYWYPLDTGDPTERIWVLLDSPRNRNDYIRLCDCLAFTERNRKGRWLCWVKIKGYMECIGDEHGRKEAMNTIRNKFYR